MRTRIVLGSSHQPSYIHREVYCLLSSFITLPPAEIEKRSNLLEFEVPHAHVSRGLQPDHIYHVQTDEHMQVCHLENYHYQFPPLHLRLTQAPKADRFDRLSIFRECLDGPFLLKKGAMYSNVQVIEEETKVQLEGWDFLWTTVLQKRWVCPYDSSLDTTKLVFRCKPVYSVHILVEGEPKLETIKKFIRFAFPDYFSGCYVPLLN